jgi:hypothetical protein
MKKVLMIMLAAGVMAFTACSDKKDKDHDDMDQLTQNEEDHGEGEEGDVVFETNEAGGYGDVVTPEGAMEIAALVADMDKADGYSGKVKGTVVASCQNKGCWMKMDCGNGEEMMVSFKDYGFFVPFDISGKEVVIEGTAEMKEVSVDELRHLAEDAGKTAEEIEAITESKNELNFVADGVIIVG